MCIRDRRKEEIERALIRFAQGIGRVERLLPPIKGRDDAADDGARGQGFVRHVKRKIGEGKRRLNRTGKRIFTHQQAQKRGLAPAVAADKAQPPVTVQREADVFKERRKTAGIGKGKMRYAYKRHRASLKQQNTPQEKPAARRPDHPSSPKKRLRPKAYDEKRQRGARCNFFLLRGKKDGLRPFDRISKHQQKKIIIAAPPRFICVYYTLPLSVCQSGI